MSALRVDIIEKKMESSMQCNNILITLHIKQLQVEICIHKILN